MSKYLQKLTELDQRLGLALVHDQVKEIKNIIKVVTNHQVLGQSPQKLGINEAELADLGQSLSAKQKSDLKVANQLLNSLRQFLSLHFGIWSLPNLKTAALIRNELKIKSCCEVMAGNGYWSLALKKVGVKVYPTDSMRWAQTSKTGRNFFLPVNHASAAKAIFKYPSDAILCSWAPNFGTSDISLVKSWRKLPAANHLLFIGEYQGVTNTSSFWQNNNFKKNKALQVINASFSSFDFIDEKLFEVK